MKKTLKIGLIPLALATSLYGSGSHEPTVEAAQDSKKAVDTTYINNTTNAAIELDGLLTDSGKSNATLQSGAKLGAVVGISAYNYDKIKAYNIPFGFGIDNHLISASISYLKNDYSDKNGMGDSSLGYGYIYNLSEVRTITNFTVGLPTGKVERQLGTGAYSYTLSQSFKKSFESLDIYGALSYTYMDKSKSYYSQEIEYGNRITGYIGAQKSISDFLVKSKFIYFNAKSDITKFSSGVEWNNQNDVKYYDLDLNVGYEIFGGQYLAAGATFALSESYGEEITDDESRSNVYYLNFTSKF